jgi:DNA-binding NtrC family response regulator
MPTVLVVDDDTAVRTTVADSLIWAGFQVVVAEDTVVAPRQLDAHPEIDVCLLDLVMPSDVPDGLALARSIRERTPNMPLILMTAYYSAAMKLRASTIPVLYKPFRLAQLVGEIDRQLRA